MMDFPRAVPGQPLPLSAREWNNLVDQVRRLEAAVLTRRGTVTNFPGGIVVSDPPRPRGGPSPDRYVMVVAHPAAGAISLRVREIRYQGHPAEPCVETAGQLQCTYTWAGFTFDAMPIFGKTAAEYDAEIVAGLSEASATPPSDGVVRRCFQSYDTWVVDRVAAAAGGTQVQPAIVTQVGAATVTMQLMKRSSTGAWIADGPLLTNVPLLGDQTGPDLNICVSSVTGSGRWFILAVQFDGEWHAMQYIWFEQGTLSTAQRGDCI